MARAAKIVIHSRSGRGTFAAPLGLVARGCRMASPEDLVEISRDDQTSVTVHLFGNHFKTDLPLLNQC